MSSRLQRLPGASGYRCLHELKAAATTRIMWLQCFREPAATVLSGACGSSGSQEPAVRAASRSLRLYGPSRSLQLQGLPGAHRKRSQSTWLYRRQESAAASDSRSLLLQQLQKLMAMAGFQEPMATAFLRSLCLQCGLEYSEQLQSVLGSRSYSRF
jgi:hypothetical protein